MAHGITATDSMAFTGELPWHGLGTKVDDGMTVDQMLEAAGLTWQVLTAPLFFIDTAGKQRRVEDKVMIRSDNSEILDTVGKRYVPAQNTEIFEFFREYVEVGDMSLNTAGSLWGGRYVWALAKFREGFTLAGGDKVEGYLLVSNPNKYGAGMVVKLVMTRVVCWNTLTMSLQETGNRVVIAHNRAFDENARIDAKMKIGLATNAMERFEAEANAFTKVEGTVELLTKVVKEAFDYPEVEEVLADTKPGKRILELYSGAGIGAALPSASGTGWGILNAVTQYIDHEQGRTQDSRLRNSWFGGGEAVKTRARKVLWSAVNGGK
jgi:phage/plasmid-like protein (TIGR03299 family)